MGRRLDAARAWWALHRGESLPVLGIAASVFVIHAVWLWRYRSAGLLDFDEATYLAVAARHYQALLEAGPLGWFGSVWAPSYIAPLALAFTSLGFALFAPTPMVGFVCILLFAVGGLVATYFLGKVVGGRFVGLLSMVFVATCPPVVMYSRHYSLAAPAMAIATLALLAILRSNGFRSRGWAILFGICLGLLPLARTMAIGFVPGLWAGACVAALVRPDQRAHRLTLLFASGVIASYVASAWLWLFDSGPSVVGYVFQFGYGNRLGEYAAYEDRGLLGNLLSPWQTFRHQFVNVVFLPHLLLILGGVAALFVAVLRSLGSTPARAVMGRVAQSSLLPVVLFVFFGFLALASTQNKGTGFTVPLIPAIMVASLVPLTALARSNVRKKFLAICAAAIIVVSALPTLAADSHFATPTALPPALGSIPVTDGRSFIQLYGSACDYAPWGTLVPIDEPTARGWVALGQKTASLLSDLGGDHSLTAFGFRHCLLNPNFVQFHQFLSKRPALMMRHVEPGLMANSTEAYVDWLTIGDAATAEVLVTTPEGVGHIRPTHNDTNMERAAAELRFERLETLQMPDGRPLTFWARSGG